jgi:hypothetical protein
VRDPEKVPREDCAHSWWDRQVEQLRELQAENVVGMVGRGRDAKFDAGEVGKAPTSMLWEFHLLHATKVGYEAWNNPGWFGHIRHYLSPLKMLR